MKKKNVYNHALEHADYEDMVRDANAGKMTRPQIARKYKTSEAHVVSIFGFMRKEGVEVRRFSWDNKREQLRLAVKTLKAEQKAQREKEMQEAARQLKMEQGSATGHVGSGAAGASQPSGAAGTGAREIGEITSGDGITTSFDEREDNVNKVP